LRGIPGSTGIDSIKVVRSILVDKADQTVRKLTSREMVTGEREITRLHQTVEHQDTPQIRGMIRKVSHLVKVEEV